MAESAERALHAELRRVAELLRILLAEERAAIVKLDRLALSELAARKLETANLFAALQTDSRGPVPPDLDELIAVLRLEARVTATMSSLAAEAVRGAIDDTPPPAPLPGPDSSGTSGVSGASGATRDTRRLRRR